jgi:hypothetical protein
MSRGGKDRRGFFPVILLTASLAVFVSGCGGYSLGPTNGQPAGSRSILVGHVANGTDEPRLADSVSHALRAQVQGDGTFRLATGGDGDIVITTALRRFDRNPLTFQRTDIVATRDYDVLLTAHVKAIERGSGKVLLDQDITGRTTIRNTTDLGSAERQATPLLAENLARNIISRLSEGSW